MLTFTLAHRGDGALLSHAWAWFAADGLTIVGSGFRPIPPSTDEWVQSTAVTDPAPPGAAFIQWELYSTAADGETFPVVAFIDQAGIWRGDVEAWNEPFLIQPDADARYVNRTGDTMTGPLTASSLQIVDGGWIQARDVRVSEFGMDRLRMGDDFRNSRAPFVFVETDPPNAQSGEDGDLWYRIAGQSATGWVRHAGQWVAIGPAV